MKSYTETAARGNRNIEISLKFNYSRELMPSWSDKPTFRERQRGSDFRQGIREIRQEIRENLERSPEHQKEEELHELKERLKFYTDNPPSKLYAKERAGHLEDVGKRFLELNMKEDANVAFEHAAVVRMMHVEVLIERKQLISTDWHITKAVEDFIMTGDREKVLRFLTVLGKQWWPELIEAYEKQGVFEEPLNSYGHLQRSSPLAIAAIYHERLAGILNATGRIRDAEFHRTRAMEDRRKALALREEFKNYSKFTPERKVLYDKLSSSLENAVALLKQGQIEKARTALRKFTAAIASDMSGLSEDQILPEPIHPSSELYLSVISIRPRC